jgi:hypothetical protein
MSGLGWDGGGCSGLCSYGYSDLRAAFSPQFGPVKRFAYASIRHARTRYTGNLHFTHCMGLRNVRGYGDMHIIMRGTEIDITTRDNYVIRLWVTLGTVISLAS